MPFTPYHLGPGALFKAIGGKRFSFMVFGGSQVLIDIEPLVRIIRGDDILHGPTHTLFGAFSIAMVAGLSGKPISELVFRLAGMEQLKIGWGVSFVSAFAGTYSHIALDAVIHGDMRPLAPMADSNGLLDAISVADMHLLCLASAALAGVIFLFRVRQTSHSEPR